MASFEGGRHGWKRARKVGFTGITFAVALIAGTLTGVTLAGGPRRGDGAATVRVLSSLETVRPRATPIEGATRSASLSAARGEWESFQVLVRAGAGGITALDASATPLLGPRGGSLKLDLSRVAFVEVSTPSNTEGAPGRWPDPLVPVVDTYAGERRNALPVHVAPGEDAALWVDVWVPRDAPPGDYRGALRLRDGARAIAEVPVDLHVHRFVLPATSSLPVTFGVSSAVAARGLLGRPPTATESLDLARVLSVLALRHRISLHGGTFTGPPCTPLPGGGVSVDFTDYDAEVGAFLDGKADARGPGAGARWSALDLRPPDCPAAAREAGLREMARHLADRGWLDRAFAYVADEPPAARLPTVEADAARVARAWPSLRRLVTVSPTSRLGSVDLFCPPVNLVDNRPSPTPLDELAATPEGTDRRRIWWYQSCLSHGCDGVGSGYFTGWPSRVIDAPPVAQRVFEWLAFSAGVGGELYYNTVEAWVDGDPWVDARRHGGNGDGTLIYPGRPERIGGRTPVPIESIRLARIRDGLEDYEYLALLARSDRATAVSMARSIAPRAFRWEH